jgi:hypothetical protein
MSNQQLLERAKTFVYRNARQIDRRRYEYFFEGGSGEAVIEALRAYQNPDGGFGNALEPDIRCPHSQPIPTEMALLIMDEAGDFDSQLLEGVIRYLRSNTLAGGGIPRAFRSLNDYPHAPWWNTERDDRPCVNPTGRIIGLLYKQQVRSDIFQEEWFRQNVAYLWNAMEKEIPMDYHDGVQWIEFLQHTPDRERANSVRTKLDKWLARPGMIELDPEAKGYEHKVLDWAPMRDSYARQFVSEDNVKKHLQALLDQQQEDGGWQISFPAVSPGGEAEWRGWVTVERLKTLKSYGVIG